MRFFSYEVSMSPVTVFSQLTLDRIKRLIFQMFQMRQQFANKPLQLLEFAELAHIIDQKSAKGWFGIKTGNG